MSRSAAAAERELPHRRPAQGGGKRRRGMRNLPSAGPHSGLKASKSDFCSQSQVQAQGIFPVPEQALGQHPVPFPDAS